MVLESTVICVDNSEYMRNGDFVPNRLQAQQDAANLVLQCKLRSNPENAVGVLSMADRVEVLATMTQDNSKLFMKLHQLQPRGSSNFLAGIRVAHLALKHRQNRNHRMRIVFFIGSPMDQVQQAELVKLAKKLKKEKVQMDVICFGESDSENSEKMTSFIETLNGKDGTGSHLVVVPAGSQLPEALLTSPICRGEDGGAPVAVPGAGTAGFDFGIDASEDPELAMALRVSLEEQRQRQEQETRRVVEESGEQPISADSGGPNEENEQMDTEPNIEAMTEEEQLAWALRMSLADSGTQEEVAGTSESKVKESKDVVEMDVGDDGEPKVVEATSSESEELGQLMSDPAALQELIASLPGVDADSEIIRQAVQEASGQKKEEKDDSKKPKE